MQFDLHLHKFMPYVNAYADIVLSVYRSYIYISVSKNSNRRNFNSNAHTAAAKHKNERMQAIQLVIVVF